MEKFIIACDLGTMAVKVGVVHFDHGLIRALAKAAPACEMPTGTFDPQEYLDVLCTLIRELVAGARIASTDLAGLVFSSQRSTTVILDKDRHPIGPALSWQGTVCEKYASKFYDRFGAERYAYVSGLPPSAIYTAAKLAYLAESDLERVRGAHKIAFLPDYIYTALGAGDVVSDVSGGSASGLFDVSQGTWSREIIDALGLRPEQLPMLLPAGSRIGEISDRGAEMTGLPRGLPLLLGGADQQCATLGAGGLQGGQGVLSLGTAGVSQVVLEQLPAKRSQGVLHMCHAAPNRWVAEGFTGPLGAAFNWAAQLLGLHSVSELETLARSAQDQSESLVFLPFLAGIGTPDFDAGTRGAFLGLGLESGPPSVASAVFRGGALELRRTLDCLRKNHNITRLISVGGGSSLYFLQVVSDKTGLPVDLVDQREAALLGAAALGFAGLDEALTLAELAERFAPPVAQSLQPNTSHAFEEELYRRYCRAVALVKTFTGEHEE